LAAPSLYTRGVRAITNWGGNYTYRAADLLEPASVEELQQLLPTLTHVKALGARHSFNSIADTRGTQISLARFKSTSLDTTDVGHPAVTIGAGVTYGELAPVLHRNGYALPNLASLPHISVAGACATATHGSGLRNQCLSTAVRSLEIVTASGELVQLSRGATPEIFPGCVVSLGALGIVTSLTLDLVPTFDVAQTVYENLSFDELEHNLLPIFAAGYSVSLFTDWQQHRATQVWVKRTLSSTAEEPIAETFFGATRQNASLHPIAGVSAENCTEQLGIPGPWHQRLPHFRMEYTPSAGAEIQSEYFVPLTHAADAIRAVEELRDRITPLLFVSELRTIAADDLWLSMAYARDSLAIHFTWHPQPEAVLAVLPQIDSQLAPFAARPHWGKLFTLSAAQVQPLYPRMKAFRELAAQLDPRGTLRNDFLAECLAL
jgi:xylitol oxidase